MMRALLFVSVFCFAVTLCAVTSAQPPGMPMPPQPPNAGPGPQPGMPPGAGGPHAPQMSRGMGMGGFGGGGYAGPGGMWGGYTGMEPWFIDDGEALVQALQFGLIAGDADRNLRLTEPATRYELAAMWARVANILELEGDMPLPSKLTTDIPAGHWATENVHMLIELGSLSPTPYADVDPLGEYARALSATGHGEMMYLPFDGARTADSRTFTALAWSLIECARRTGYKLTPMAQQVQDASQLQPMLSPRMRSSPDLSRAQQAGLAVRFLIWWRSPQPMMGPMMGMGMMPGGMPGGMGPGGMGPGGMGPGGMGPGGMGPGGPPQMMPGPGGHPQPGAY